MRISDWSSDVCSSDLVRQEFLRARVILRGHHGRLRERRSRTTHRQPPGQHHRARASAIDHRMHAVRPVSNAAHVVRAVRTMLTRTRVTCGALPARGARRRVAPAFHETDTMKPLDLAIALALPRPVAASAPAPDPHAATAATAPPPW